MKQFNVKAYSYIALLYWIVVSKSLSESGCPVSVHSLTTLVLIWIVFTIIWEMFHRRISLNSVLLPLLVNSVNGFSLESMYTLILNISSNLTYLWSFQFLVLLPYVIEITFLFVPTESITSQKLGSWDFWQIANSVLNMANLLYLLYSTARRCSLLHLV